MGACFSNVQGGVTRAELAAGVQPEERPLTALQFRAVSCIFGVLMTVGGSVYMGVMVTIDGSVPVVAVLLMCIGLVLLVLGIGCCVIAVKRGEPPIPPKYRLQRLNAAHQVQHQQQMQRIQNQQYQPQYGNQYSMFSTPNSQYPHGAQQGYPPAGPGAPGFSPTGPGYPPPGGGQGYPGTNGSDPPPYSTVVGQGAVLHKVDDINYQKFTGERFIIHPPPPESFRDCKYP